MNTNQLANAKKNLEGLLNSEQFQRSLADVAPKHITKERIVKLALVAASRQPRLFECTPQSFLQSVMKAAELGLDCVGTLGQGYLVPYYNSKIKSYECQFIAGYQGLIELARRSGNIARIESRVVYEKDAFEVEYGLNQKLVHKPYLGGDRGNIVCVYAIAELKDGSKQLEVMTIDEVNRIRDRSKAKDSGPWVTDFAEMARKTVVRRLAKYLPLSPDLVKAIETDDQQFDSRNQAADIAANMQAGVEGLKKRLKKKVDAKQVEEPPAEESPAAAAAEEAGPEESPAAAAAEEAGPEESPAAEEAEELGPEESQPEPQKEEAAEQKANAENAPEKSGEVHSEFKDWRYIHRDKEDEIPFGN